MSLELSFTITPDCGCNKFTFTETTGVYADPANLTGWGAPNLEVADIDTASIDITDPAGEEYRLDVLADLQASGDFSKTITVSDVGLEVNQILPGGQWKFVFSVTDTDTNITINTEVVIFLWCSYKECLKNKVIALKKDSCCGKCQEAAKAEIQRIRHLLISLEYAAECKDIVRFNEFAAALDKICSTDSKCGCS